MDDLTAYYPPIIHQPYYQPPPPPPPGTSYAPPPPGTAYAPPPAVAQPTHGQPEFAAYAPPVYPQSSYDAPPVYPPSSYDQVRTLFVAGLPEDVKAREIYNLFHEFPGYQSSNLRAPTSSKSQPFAFATFMDQQSAIMALHALNGMVFDLEKGSTLHIDLAKSNSRSKRSRSDDDRQGSEKRQKGPAAFSRSYDPGFGSVHMPGMGNSAYNTIGYPSTQRLRAEQKHLQHALFPSLNLGYVGGLVNEGATKSNNTPCPTLFVANLGPTCSDEELMQVFSRCRGFIKLKMQSTYGAPVAFVDFQDTACSTEALSHLQGTVLYSSTSGEGMRLEYAKSRMGMRSKKSR